LSKKPDANELFARADKALFQAKQAGRNRVVVWSEDK
jgi:PleD family two-component response regulator